MKFLLSDILAVGIGAVVVAGFGFLYYKDISKGVEASSCEQVATLTYKRDITERKFSGQVVWEDVETETTLCNNDSVRTLDESEAEIKLNDGTIITLNENSMIVLTQSKNAIDIEFSRGSISTNRSSLDTGRKLNIKSGNTNISIEKSDINLSQAKGNLNVQVAKGSASIDTGTGQKDIGTDKQVLVSGSEINDLNFGIKLTNPAKDNYSTTQTAKKQMNFQWEKLKGRNIYLIEISDDFSFENPINRKELPGNTYTILLDKGIYYWRVKTNNRGQKKQEISETRRLTILLDAPIALVYPRNNESIKYRTTLPVINFKWSDSEIAKYYKVTFARDKDFRDIINTYETYSNNLVLDSLVKGTYFWKVEPVSGIGISQTSPVSMSKFQVAEKDIIPAPELIYPNEGKQFSAKMLEQKKITFTWKNNPDIKEYIFQLSDGKDFKNIIFTGQSVTNFIRIDRELGKDEYFWKVIAKVDDEDIVSGIRNFSITDIDKVALLYPKDDSIIVPDENQKFASIRFSWEQTGISGKYKVRVSDKKDFSSAVKESAVSSISNATEITGLNPGEYYWKVELVDEDGSAVLKSNDRRFVVKSALKLPEPITPASGAVVNMSRKDILSFKWKNTEGANLYRFILYQKKLGRDKKIIDVEQANNGFDFKDLSRLDTGGFYWTLQAFDKDNDKIIRESSVLKNDFEITLGAIEKPDVNSLKIENL